MQLRIPPVAGGGLPVGEIVLLLSLMTINYTGVLGRLSLTVAMVPLGDLVDLRRRPRAVRLRRARHLGAARCRARAGIAVPAGRLRVRRRPARASSASSTGCPSSWSSACSTACSIRSGSRSGQLSPTITSGTGFNVPIFGSMTNTPQIMVVAAFYLLLFHGNRLLANLVAVLMHRLHDRDVPGAHPLSGADRGVRLPRPVPALQHRQRGLRRLRVG